MNIGLISPHRGALLLVAMTLALAGPATAAETTVAVRISATSADHAETNSISPVASVDYGSFRWWLIQPADLTRLDDHGIAHQRIPDAYRLNLGEQSFDPLTETPEHPPEWVGRPHPGPDLFLIQAMGPIREDWLGDLRTAGIEPVQYIHPFTYAVWGQPDPTHGRDDTKRNSICPPPCHRVRGSPRPSRRVPRVNAVPGVPEPRPSGPPSAAQRRPINVVARGTIEGLRPR